ncbi:hypothetical protein OQA88_3012 [Cercophora sp. LCS_1]
MAGEGWYLSDPKWQAFANPLWRNPTAPLPILDLPPSDPGALCDACAKARAGDGYYTVNMHASDSACPSCRLLQQAVLLACNKGTELGLGAPLGHVDNGLRVHCRGGVLAFDDLKFDNSFNGNDEDEDILQTERVFVYTRFGEPPTVWPVVGVGRDVGGRRESYLQVVTEWMRVCRDQHSGACPPMAEGQPLPKRILDAGTDPEGAFVVLAETTPGQRGVYFALSHCWGGKIDIRTEKSNIQARKAGIRFADLPKTFQDAVEVTRALGVRYLWIDALCIIQDDAADWEVESGNMAAIYANAQVVIGADKANSSQAGFLDVGPGGYHDPPGIPIAVLHYDGINSTVYARAGPQHHNPCLALDELRRGDHYLSKWFKRDALASRAWTLQEKLLAARMVHFAAKELIWECRTAVSCECFEMDPASHPTLWLRDQFSLHTALASPSSLAWSAAKFTTWYKIVNEVTRRALTEPSDIFPCLSGVARRFQDAGAGPYLAGLWRDDLLRGLLWASPREAAGSRMSQWRAPSWSWASLGSWSSSQSWSAGANVPYQEEALIDSNLPLAKTYAKVLDAACTTRSKDPLGAVSNDCSLKLEAPVVPMRFQRLRDDSSYWGRYLIILDVKRAMPDEALALATKKGGSYRPRKNQRRNAETFVEDQEPDLIWVRYDTDFPSREDIGLRLHCLLLGEIDDDEAPRWRHEEKRPGRGLILRKCGGLPVENRFERVGCFEATRKQTDKLLQAGGRTAVVLI